jgi:hypothetical protein
VLHKAPAHAAGGIIDERDQVAGRSAPRPPQSRSTRPLPQRLATHFRALGATRMGSARSDVYGWIPKLVAS